MAIDIPLTPSQLATSLRPTADYHEVLCANTAPSETTGAISTAITNQRRAADMLDRIVAKAALADIAASLDDALGSGVFLAPGDYEHLRARYNELAAAAEAAMLSLRHLA